jgi:hypothetical protein
MAQPAITAHRREERLHRLDLDASALSPHPPAGAFQRIRNLQNFKMEYQIHINPDHKSGLLTFTKVG